MIRRSYIKKKFNLHTYKSAKTVSSIKKKLKKLCSMLTILRDKKCLRCGAVNNLQASHIKSVGAYPNMRFDLDNIITLCWRCHFHFWHKNPLEASEWIKKLKGEEFIDKLNLKARTFIKRYRTDYIAIYCAYKEKLKGGKL